MYFFHFKNDLNFKFLRFYFIFLPPTSNLIYFEKKYYLNKRKKKTVNKKKWENIKFIFFSVKKKNAIQFHSIKHQCISCSCIFFVKNYFKIRKKNWVYVCFVCNKIFRNKYTHEWILIELLVIFFYSSGSLS